MLSATQLHHYRTFGFIALRKLFSIEEAFAALDALYNVLDWKDKELLTTSQERRQRYMKDLTAPHPEFGVSFMIGKTFAELCGGTDIALMTSGSKLFLETVKATKEMIKQISGEYRIVR
jgi:hypothetical protein